MKIIIKRYWDGQLIVGGDKYEVEERETKAGWARPDVEDASSHPVLKRQLKALAKADEAAFVELTAKPFTIAALNVVCAARGITV